MTGWRSIVLSAVLLLGCWGGPSHAQALTWEINAGFSGVQKAGAWTPVFVDITNTGDSQQGELAIPVSAVEHTPFGSEERHVNYTIPVDAPRNSKKRHTLYLPSGKLGEAKLLLSGGAQTREIPPGPTAEPEDTLAIVVGGDTGLLRFLTGAKAYDLRGPSGSQDPYSRGGSRAPEIMVGHADWDRLPDSWLGWDGVDAVILGDALFAGASQEAVEALLQWVELGGSLVVAGGVRSQEIAHSPIAPMLPYRVTGTKTLPDLAELGRWVGVPIAAQPVVVVEGELAPEVEVLCGTREQPLIAARRVGLGRVVLTAFDYTASPVKYWDGQNAMWPLLLARAAPPQSLTDGSETPGEYWRWRPGGSSLAEAATYTPEARLPPVWMIIVFLGAYVIVLVPVNHYSLHRIGRRQLAWVTIPAIVFLFALLAYALGYGIRGGALVLNRLSIVETQAGAQLARGRGYLGVFSPGRRTYEVLLSGSAAGARDLMPPAGAARTSPFVYYGARPRIANIRMNMWTSRAFGVDFLADLGGGVDGTIEYDGAALRAHVQNNTGFPLTQCRLVAGRSQGLDKKDLMPGEATELALDRGLPIAVQRGPMYPRRQTYEQAEVKPTVVDLALRALFARHGMSGGSAGTSARPADNAYVLAVVEEPLVPAELSGKRPRINDVGLIFARLPTTLAAGKRIRVPEYLISTQLIASDNGIRQADPYEEGIILSDGSSVFEFRLPLGPAGGRATDLAMTAPLTFSGSTGGPSSGAARGPVAGPGTPQPPSVRTRVPVDISAYDFTGDRWATIGVAGAAVRMPFPRPASAYMSRDGRVRVKLTVPSGEARFEVLALEAEVETFGGETRD